MNRAKKLKNLWKHCNSRGFGPSGGAQTHEPRGPKPRVLSTELYPDIKLEMVLEVGVMWYKSDYTRIQKELNNSALQAFRKEVQQDKPNVLMFFINQFGMFGCDSLVD